MVNAASPSLDERQNVRWREGQFADIAANRPRNRASDGCADVQDWHFAGAFGPQGADGGGTFVEINLHRHDIPRQRHEVVFKARLFQCAIRADGNLFVQRVA